MRKEYDFSKGVRGKFYRDMEPTHKRMFIGGLMRCCIQTLDERADEYDTGREIDPVGTVLPCKWCKSSVILTGTGWRWNQADDGRPERSKSESGQHER